MWQQHGKKIIGVHTIGKVFAAIEMVLLIDGLKLNVIGISLLCDQEYDIKFSPSHCFVNLSDDIICMNHITTVIMHYLSVSFILNIWRSLMTFARDRGLYNANMLTLIKLSKNELANSLPKLDFWLKIKIFISIMHKFLLCLFQFFFNIVIKHYDG